MQYMAARVHVPLMTSYVDETDVCDMIEQLTEKIEHYRRLNFDWIVFRINYLRLCWGSYRSPMECSFIPTPRWLALKRAIVNVQCFDDVRNSFQYSVLAGMNLFSSAHHKLRAAQYIPFLGTLNMNGIQTPVDISSIDKFEKQNPKTSVNVLGVDDDRDIICIRTSKFCSQRKHHVNFLMLTDQNKFHYVSIQSLSRLVTSRIKYNGKNIYVTIVCICLID